MAELVATLPSQEVGAVHAEVRGRIYREELSRLTDAQWSFAVREAIRRERWFPTVAALREYAAEYQVPTKLLGPGRSDDQRDLDREEARRGLELIRQHNPWLAGVAVKEMPRG